MHLSSFFSRGCPMWIVLVRRLQFAGSLSLPHILRWLKTKHLEDNRPWTQKRLACWLLQPVHMPLCRTPQVLEPAPPCSFSSRH